MMTFQIFPRFVEFVLLFGTKKFENEIGPPQLRFRKLTTRGDSSCSRRYIGFGMNVFPDFWHLFMICAECAYALRYVELNHRTPNNPWSIRQCAVYNKYKAATQSSTWVLISASSVALENLDRYIKAAKTVYCLDPFEIHLILLDTALANWRLYLISITEKISDMVSFDKFPSRPVSELMCDVV